MEEKISKKSYYLPNQLMYFFVEWCKPGRDYSPQIAGAILLWILTAPSLREKFRKLAYSNDVKKALQEAGELIRKNISDSFITGHMKLMAIEKHAFSVAESLETKKMQSASPEIKITSTQQNVEAIKKSIKTFLKMNAKDYAEAAKYLNEDEQNLFDELRKFKGSKGQKEEKEKSA
jgi:hypothetical protein